MKKITVVPKKSVGDVLFGVERVSARKEFGKKYKEIKKNIFSKNTMDAYDDYHLYYSKDNTFEAFEVFGNVQILVDGNVVFPGTVNDIRKVFPGLKNDGDGMIDKKNAVAITVSQDDEGIVDSVLFGNEGYFS